MRCGPTDHEVVAAVLMALPLAMAAALGLMRLWSHLWRRLQPSAGMLAGRALALWVGSAAVALLVALTLGRRASIDVWTWWPYAVAVYGPSCLTATIVAFWWGRQRFGADPYSWAAASGVAVASAPAVLLWLTARPGDAVYQEAYVAIWLFSGGVGLVPLVLLAGSVLWLRRRVKQVAADDEVPESTLNK